MKDRWLAGLDRDGKVRIFRPDGTTPVDRYGWIGVLDALGAEPGEMLEVTLRRTEQENRDG